MRQFNTILAILIISLFSGCAIVNEYEDSFKFKYHHSTAVTDFSELTGELIDSLAPTLINLRNQHPIYVIDFVNLKELENHSELGFMLSDEVKTHITQKIDWSVQSIEYTKYLKIGANGTKVLSRDIDQLKTTKVNSNTYALVGTYAFTQRQLILYLKLIELNKGVILKSATKATELTDEIINLELKIKKEREAPIYQPMVL